MSIGFDPESLMFTTDWAPLEREFIRQANEAGYFGFDVYKFVMTIPVPPPTPQEIEIREFSREWSQEKELRDYHLSQPFLCQDFGLCAKKFANAILISRLEEFLREGCTCASLRKKNDWRACPWCTKNYRSDCLCNGVGCVACCGPS